MREQGQVDAGDGRAPVWPGFPEGRRIATNGIELVVHEAGAGRPIVLLHGFPELAFSWRHQVTALVDAGYRAIVPNHRGYDGSDAPSDPTAYSVKTIVEDAVGVLDALGVDRAVWVADDWGGMPAWWSGIYAPERVDGIVGVCTPYAPRGEVDLVEAYRRARGDATYILTFQEAGVAEAMLERDVEASFRAMLRGVGVTQSSSSRPARRSRPFPPAASSGSRSSSASRSSARRSSPSTSTRTSGRGSPAG